MYSYGSPHMAAQKQGDQLERTFSSYVRIQDVVLKTYLGRWTIGRSGKSTIWWWWFLVGDVWVCSIALQCSFSSCPSWPVIKIGSFSFCIINTEWLWTWLSGIVVNNGLDLTNSSILIRMIRVRLPSCCIFIITIGLIQLFFNPLHCF